MKITLVRHGEVEEKYHGCYNGHIDIGLSDKGKAQAKELSKCLPLQAYDAVFCSDLKRCRQSLDAFDLEIKAVYTQALREKSWGRHEGMSFEQIIQSESFAYESFEQWINALDGEDYSAYIERIKNFFFAFLPANPYDNVLIVTHAGVIRVLLHLVKGISLQEAFSSSFAYADYITLNTQNWEFGDVQCV